jgi:hypothetical protein
VPVQYSGRAITARGPGRNRELDSGRYRTIAVHVTSDPETSIVEQEALGTSASTGEWC